MIETEADEDLDARCPCDKLFDQLSGNRNIRTDGLRTRAMNETRSTDTRIYHS